VEDGEERMEGDEKLAGMPLRSHVGTSFSLHHPRLSRMTDRDAYLME
jgi:hypothetical protein